MAAHLRRSVPGRPLRTLYYEAGDVSIRRGNGKIFGVPNKTFGATKKSKRLQANIAELVDCSAQLRQLLQRYESDLTTVAASFEEGAPALVATNSADLPLARRQVTEGIEKFEATRHRLRLELFTLAMDEGASISAVGRVLGVSRQLASRLAAEATRRAS